MPRTDIVNNALNQTELAKRGFVMWQRWLNSILGIWLALAPIVRMDSSSVRLNNLFVGVLAAVVSSTIPIVATIWESGLGVAAGAWVAFSCSFRVFSAGEGYIWNSIASGLLIIASAQWAARRAPSKSVSSEHRQI